MDRRGFFAALAAVLAAPRLLRHFTRAPEPFESIHLAPKVLSAETPISHQLLRSAGFDALPVDYVAERWTYTPASPNTMEFDGLEITFE